MKRNWQTPALLAAIALGLALPQLHVLSFVVRAMTMIMLFFAFAGLRAENLRFHRSQAALLAAAPALALAAYFALRPFDLDWALAALLIALTPTAAASPVVTALLGGDAAYPALMVLASSVAQPLAMALLLPLLGDGRRVEGVMDLMGPLLATIAVPFVLALLARRFLPKPMEALRRRPSISFCFWVSNLVIVSSVASDFIRSSGASHLRIFGIGLLSLVMCVVNFMLGRLIGGKKHRVEAGQSLGQKNTAFTVWAALSFVNPLVALGPAFYILWHNLWNAWQIHLRSRPAADGK